MESWTEFTIKTNHFNLNFKTFFHCTLLAIQWFGAHIHNFTRLIFLKPIILFHKEQYIMYNLLLIIPQD
jgi:hypothetical protein